MVYKIIMKDTDVEVADLRAYCKKHGVKFIGLFRYLIEHKDLVDKIFEEIPMTSDYRFKKSLVKNEEE